MSSRDVHKKEILFLGAHMDMGGIAHAFNMLAPKLEEEGFKISVVTPHKADLLHLAIPLRYVKGYVWRFKIENKWILRFVNFFNWLTHWKVYFFFAKKFSHDVFVVYAANMLPQWVVYSRKPTIGWLHGRWALRMDSFMGPFFRRKVNRISQEYFDMIGVSKAVCMSWEKEFLLRKNIKYIPNIVNPRSIIDDLKNDRAEISLKSNPVLLVVGRLSYEKGQLRLLKVLSRLSKEGYRFSAYFIGSGNLEELCKQEALKLNLQETVFFLGEKENPYPYMKQADLLIVPSYHEGRPCVITEALVLGVPVLSTDSGGPRELLKDGEWGRLVENSTEGLYLGIKSYLINPSAGEPLVDSNDVIREYEHMDKTSLEHIVASINRALK